MSLRILQVVHGYPPRYNAGSEVYTQLLARALAQRHQVRVFTRQEAPFLPLGHVSREADQAVALTIVNVHGMRDRYCLEEVDTLFERELLAFRPQLLHVQHLNHLSTNLLEIARRHRIPVLYTLHDFWLMCPRGQFLQLLPEEPGQVYALCPGQEDGTCARRCYARYFSGQPAQAAADLAHWTSWVAGRMQQVRQGLAGVSRFIAPSRQLLARFRDEFGLPDEKLLYLDYGFDHGRLASCRRVPEEEFVFGYIGTHIPAKGVHDLLKAFARLPGSARLRIWGRRTIEHTRPLEQFCRSLPESVQRRIEWQGEYDNERIASEVLSRVDAIVVPSIWLENSPLVIHEAQQARVPVITADAGGMAEFVQHEVNGLLFRHRDPVSLAEQMQRLAADRAWAQTLGRRGYLYSASDEIPSLAEHTAAIEALYAQVLRESAEQGERG